MAQALNKLLQDLINSTSIHCILSAIIGYSLWLTIASQLTVTTTITFPIFIQESNQEQRFTSSPSCVHVTVRGQRAALLELLQHNPCIMLPSGQSTIQVEPSMIALPTNITLINATPTIIEVTPVTSAVTE